MKITINHKGKKVSLNVKKAGFFSEGLGLMFKSRNTKSLLFEFKKDRKISITSYFVFFPFLAIWLDKENNFIESKVVKPFRFMIKPKKKFRKFIEMPANEKNSKVIGFFVGKGKGLNRINI